MITKDPQTVDKDEISQETKGNFVTKEEHTMSEYLYRSTRSIGYWVRTGRSTKDVHCTEDRTGHKVPWGHQSRIGLIPCSHHGSMEEDLDKTKDRTESLERSYDMLGL